MGISFFQFNFILGNLNFMINKFTIRAYNVFRGIVFLELTDHGVHFEP